MPDAVDSFTPVGDRWSNAFVHTRNIAIVLRRIDHVLPP
jgi:hypothetical protein